MAFSLRPVQPVAYSIYPPSIFARLNAQNLDALVAALATAVVVLVARLLSIPDTAIGVIGWAFFVLAVLLADALPHGQSIGKRILGLAVVVNGSGQPCSAPRSLARNLFMVLGLIDWAFMLRKTRRRLGDYVAGTRVVRLARAA